MPGTVYKEGEAVKSEGETRLEFSTSSAAVAVGWNSVKLDVTDGCDCYSKKPLCARIGPKGPRILSVYCKCLKKMAGTTRLETSTPALTVHFYLVNMLKYPARRATHNPSCYPPE